jgi:hypothetical protein
MSTVEHVALLACDPLPAERARFPFIVGILEKLAVQSPVAGLELVAAHAKFRPLEGGCPGGAAMGLLVVRRGI